MNFILGFFIAIVLTASSNSQYLAGTLVAQTAIDRGEHGLMKGDRIVSISGYKIFVGEDITFGVSRSDPTGKTQLIDLETNFEVIRNGKRTVIKNVRPFARITGSDGEEQDSYSFYVYPEKKGALNVVKHGFFKSLSYVRTTVLGLVDLVTGRLGIDSLGGVVKVGQVMGEVRQYGISNILMLVALISVNLGVMNLLPIPALDGGRIVLLIYEGIFRKPLNNKLEYILIAGSMILLYILVFFVTVKDIVSIF